MFIDFKGKKISSLIAVVPKNERSFESDMLNYNFPMKKSLKLKELMGYGTHRIVEEGVTSSDLAIAAFKELFKKTKILPEEIDALVFVTQSPDYFIPQTSTIVQHAAGLKEDILCLDLNQGCAGFVHGLIQSFLLLDNPAFKKVALVTADILSRKVNKRDRNSHPLVGDAASVAIIENTGDDKPIFAFNKTFGSGAMVISIPAGGFKEPATEQTAREFEDVDGNFRSRNDLVMQGASVFSFVQENVPGMVEDLLGRAGVSKEQIGYYIFHQPNKFMLEKLADKLGVPYEKMPNNIVSIYGNSSSVTIPVTMAHNLSEALTSGSNKVFFAGFGVGLTLSGIIMDLEKMDVCAIVEF